MRAKTSITILMLLTALGMVSCAAGRTEQMGGQAIDHGMHGMPAGAQQRQDRALAPGAGHAEHAMEAAVADGSWSYTSRTNPKPFQDKRWEMVPVPGYGHMYVNSSSLSRELVCEALRDNPAIMVDRAARKICGMPETPTPAPVGRIAVSETAAPKETVEHEHPAGTGGMHEHWMAPEEAAARENPISADPASVERGAKLYQAHCAVCHGPTGLGDGPAGAALTPKPTNLTEMAGQHPPGDLAWKIENGRGAMPAWKGILSESQIWDLVNYIKRLGREEHHH